jgi:hypothetical protein
LSSSAVSGQPNGIDASPFISFHFLLARRAKAWRQAAGIAIGKGKENENDPSIALKTTSPAVPINFQFYECPESERFFIAEESSKQLQQPRPAD